MTVGMQDMLFATVKLVVRVGAIDFEVGYLNDDEDIPVEKAEWYAQCSWRGTRVSVGGRCSPDEACLALALRLLAGATCKCTRPVSVDDGVPGCRWRLIGDTWKSSCPDAPIPVPYQRGGTADMVDAMNRRKAEYESGSAPNRATRRAQKRRNR